MSAIFQLVVAGLLVALAVWVFYLALLLKLGKLKPGTRWGLETPLGGLLWTIAFLGAGLEWVVEVIEDSAVLEYRVPASAENVIGLMWVVGIGGALWIEARARKARKASSEGEN